MLTLTKLLHTAIWACIAACVLWLPVAGVQQHFGLAFVLSAVVVGECAVLAINRGRCPLTDIAARYTPERKDNFDIYLPLWLARHNKEIFGTLFVIGEVVVLWQWSASKH